MEEQIGYLLKNREILANIHSLEEEGAEVEYHPVDVRNPVAFGDLIEDLYRRYGRLDAVLHGAGIIEDKLIADKSLESFERVFATKTDSALSSVVN